jgi:hypothetical protein
MKRMVIYADPEKPTLLELLANTPLDAESRERIRRFIENDFN